MYKKKEQLNLVYGHCGRGCSFETKQKLLETDFDLLIQSANDPLDWHQTGEELGNQRTSALAE
jgi:hypothetical protein